MLVYQNLLVHIEVRQPVVHHDKRVDIVERIAGLSWNPIPYLHCITLPCAVSENGKLICGLQFCFLDKLPNRVGRHVPIDGIDKSYLVCFDFKPLLLHQLRNTQQFRTILCQLPRYIQTVARTREI